MPPPHIPQGAADGGEATTSVAARLSVVPQGLETRQEYEPPSAAAVGLMVRLAVVAPVTAPPSDSGVPSFRQR
jgi:hypothetical protein